ACAFYPKAWDNTDTVATLVGLMVFSVVGEVNGVYRSWRGTALREELRAALWSWLLVAPPMLIWIFASKTAAEHSRLVNFGWFGGAIALLLLVRVIKRALLGAARGRGANTRSAGIIGATAAGVRLKQQ